jgi:hypothetical protein
LLEERDERTVVGVHVASPRLVAEPRDVGEQLLVLPLERAARDVLPADERMLEEDPLRLGRHDARIVDGPVLRDSEAEERRVLFHDRARGSLGPVRIGVCPLDEMRAGLEQPSRRSGRIRFSHPRRKSIVRLRSRASSMMSVS